MPRFLSKVYRVCFYQNVKHVIYIRIPVTSSLYSLSMPRPLSRDRSIPLEVIKIDIEHGLELIFDMFGLGETPHNQSNMVSAATTAGKMGYFYIQFKLENSH